VLVSHNEDTIAALCDRVIWIEHGRSVLEADRETVFAAYHRDMHPPVGTT